MAEKPQYKTKQYQELKKYLQANIGNPVTVQQICTNFEQKGICVSMATVYRQLEKMQKRGIVAKYVTAHGGASFEYVEKEQTCCQPVCIHCKCTSCGVLFHVGCPSIQHLAKHLLTNHNFEMSAVETILYGICGKCK